MGRVFPLIAGGPELFRSVFYGPDENQDFSFRHYSTSLETISRSLYFWILPLAVVGNSSTK